MSFCVSIHVPLSFFNNSSPFHNNALLRRETNTPPHTRRCFSWWRRRQLRFGDVFIASKVWENVSQQSFPLLRRINAHSHSKQTMMKKYMNEANGKKKRLTIASISCKSTRIHLTAFNHRSSKHRTHTLNDAARGLTTQPATTGLCARRGNLLVSKTHLLTRALPDVHSQKHYCTLEDE